MANILEVDKIYNLERFIDLEKKVAPKQLQDDQQLDALKRQAYFVHERRLVWQSLTRVVNERSFYLKQECLRRLNIVKASPASKSKC